MGTRPEVSAQIVRAALARHMQLSALDIKVETRGATVFLSGVVDVLAEKLHAEEIVRHVMGVEQVENALTIANNGAENDQEIAAALKSQLHGKGKLGEVKFEVAQGVVYLRGRVETMAEEDLVRRVAAGIRGVRDVVTELVVTVEEQVDDITLGQKVEEALAGEHRIVDDDIIIRVKRGVIHLSGWVECEEMKERSTRLVAGIEGVRQVINKMLVEEDQNEGDVYLTNIITQAMHQHPETSFDMVRVLVIQGWVYLLGRVESVDQRDVLEELIHHVNENFGGLEGITNEIVVQVH